MNAFIYWLAQSGADVPEGDDWLSGGERAILAGMRFPKRRNDWRLGRWTAKQAISAYLPNNARLLSSLEIRAAADGAPEAFCDDVPEHLVISISHSNGRSLCIVGPPAWAIGCDLEHLEMRDDSLAQDYFAAEEIYFCKQAPDKAIAVNLIWSAKESALKALRAGLRRDTRSILIRPADCVAAENSWNAWKGYCLESSRVFYGWWRSDKDYIYTLASDWHTSPPQELRSEMLL
jgi:4'-phosphopantetheinyl transferase